MSKLKILFTIVINLIVMNVYADTEVSVNGVNLYAKGDYYRSVAAGNVTLSFSDNVLYPDITAVPQNYLVTFCVSDNADYSSYYYNGNLPVDGGRGDFSFHLSNYPCKIKESHTQGRILYMFGKNSVYSSVQGRNAGIDNKWVIYQYGVVNWSLFSVYFVNEPITIDYANDAVISTNKDIINQNNTIINNQGNIQSGIDDIKSDINSDNVDDPSSSINQFNDKIAENGVITQLVGLPVTLFTKILNSVNGTCSPYNFGSLFGTDIVFPCINVANYLGSTLWNIIDVLISGLFVYSLSRKFIKVFEHMSSMEEGDVIGD